MGYCKMFLATLSEVRLRNLCELKCSRLEGECPHYEEEIPLELQNVGKEALSLYCNKHKKRVSEVISENKCTSNSCRQCAFQAIFIKGEINRFKSILDPIADLLEKKNRDYGSSYDPIRSEFGEISFLIRLSDKFNRLKTLAKQPAEVVSESVEDTISDIIGYCTLELDYRRGKQIPLRPTETAYSQGQEG